MTSPPLVAIAGPTATGKTALAVRLAEHLGGEIVGADSRQVYRGMDIGTAKPSAEQRARVRHWLGDGAGPDEGVSRGRPGRHLVAPGRTGVCPGEGGGAGRRHGPVRVGAPGELASAARAARLVAA